MHAAPPTRPAISSGAAARGTSGLALSLLAHAGAAVALLVTTRGPPEPSPPQLEVPITFLQEPNSPVEPARPTRREHAEEPSRAPEPQPAPPLLAALPPSTPLAVPPEPLSSAPPPAEALAPEAASIPPQPVPARVPPAPPAEEAPTPLPDQAASPRADPAAAPPPPRVEPPPPKPPEQTARPTPARATRHAAVPVRQAPPSAPAAPAAGQTRTDLASTPIPPAPGAEPRPATPPPDPRLSAAWVASLAAWLQGHRVYPEDARRQGQEGLVIVRLIVTRDGRITEAGIIRSSGTGVLDQAALSIFRNAKLPPFPIGMPDEQRTVTVPIRYHLDDNSAG